ncbi:MAG: aldehyde dehydrogenase family protein [Pseudomonadota bacterium]
MVYNASSINGSINLETGRHLIASKWRQDGKSQRDIISPVSGLRIGTIPLGEISHVNEAVSSARVASNRFKQSSRQDRARYLRRVADRIEARRQSLVHLLTLEQGKPITQANAELDISLSALNLSAEYASTVTPNGVTLTNPLKRAFVELRPRGVYGVITPWNAPAAVPVCYYLGPGFAAGNAIIWVPAPSTSLISTQLAECFLEADPPVEGILNLVIGEGSEVGDALVAHEGVDALAFTGSTKTGNAIASRAGAKPLALELGGNGPTIIFNDADIERAAQCSAAAAFANAGQICTATERVLVHEDVYDEFVVLATGQAKATRLGDPFDVNTTLGPLHNEDTAKKVDSHIADAVQKGGRIVHGGQRAVGYPTDLYYQPTVVVDVAPYSLLNCEETFGPVIPILPFKDDSMLRTLVGKSRYGLFGSVFTKSISQAMRCAADLRVGVVNINEMSAYWEPGMPGAGASGSLSGTGRFGVEQSILGMSDHVTITMDLN